MRCIGNRQCRIQKAFRIEQRILDAARGSGADGTRCWAPKLLLLLLQFVEAGGSIVLVDDVEEQDNE